MDSLTVVHAALELVTNAVEHAYPPGIRDAEVEVRCNWTVTGEVVIDVVDHGEWRTPTYDVARGRGLAMAAGLGARARGDHGSARDSCPASPPSDSPRRGPASTLQAERPSHTSRCWSLTRDWCG